MVYSRTFSIRERYIVPVSSNFLTQISHGTRTKCHKTRAMLREFSTADCLALKQLRHLAVRVKPISCALRACFLGHYRMARMSQSASSCGLASWMRPHMVSDAHLLKLLFLARYIPRLIYNDESYLPLPFLHIINTSPTASKLHLSTFKAICVII